MMTQVCHDDTLHKVLEAIYWSFCWLLENQMSLMMLELPLRVQKFKGIHPGSRLSFWKLRFTCIHHCSLLSFWKLRLTCIHHCETFICCSPHIILNMCPMKTNHGMINALSWKGQRTQCRRSLRSNTGSTTDYFSSLFAILPTVLSYTPQRYVSEKRDWCAVAKESGINSTFGLFPGPHRWQSWPTIVLRHWEHQPARQGYVN